MLRWLPEDVSTYGREIDSLFYLIYYITAVAFILVTVLMVVFLIVYPGPDGKLNTEDDVKFDNDLHVPVNKVVRVHLTSKDVIHSFFLPSLRLKQDAVPGRTILVWFEATKPGKYELPCAELCGFGHSGMKGWLHVHSPEEYQEWAAENLDAKPQ